VVLGVLPETQQGAFSKEDGQKVIGEGGERLV
jgi:hypothetical protein